MASRDGAYNTGPGHLRRAIRDQGINDYWRLTLINEAERYVPRIVMMRNSWEFSAVWLPFR